MIIRNSWTQLQAGIMKILAHDQWSVTINVIGLDRENSEQIEYDLVLSWDEVQALNTARRRYSVGGSR